MEYVQGTAVAINGRGLLLLGPPGVGKSDLALRLIDRGAQLIADDLVPCTAIRGWPHLSAPTKRIGQLMTRDIGLARLPVISIAVPLAMVLPLLVTLLRLFSVISPKERSWPLPSRVSACTLSFSPAFTVPPALITSRLSP